MKFTEQLRFLDDADLCPYKTRLLLHYWRRGECWESLRKTADICNMSIGKASQCRAWLLANGYIKIADMDGKAAVVLCSPHEQNCSQDETTQQNCSPHEHERSPHEQNPVVNVHGMNTPIYKELNGPNTLNGPNEIITGAPARENEKIETIPFKPVENKSQAPKGAAEDRLTAVLQVCELDRNIPAALRLAENAAAQLDSYAASVILARYGRTPPASGSWYWFTDHWKGKKGQAPTPGDILQTIGQTAVSPLPAAASGQSRPVSPAMAAAVDYAALKKRMGMDG